VHVLEVSVTIDNELDNLIREQSLFEDSALEDASAYARMIIKGADRFKKERQDGTKRNTYTK
jgi:hypothetical protein